LYPGADAEFVLYEDDGRTFNHTRGEFLRTQLRLSGPPDSLAFSIRRTEGTWTPPARRWKMTFHRIGSEPRSVEGNGQPLPRMDQLTEASVGWRYETGRATLIVQIPDGADPRTILVRR
ncbi:MAG: DUF5110 domain-containing protein, partial [Gammaproteobacteria bacterium]